MITGIKSSPRLRRSNYKQISAAMSAKYNQRGALAAVPDITERHIANGFLGLARGAFNQTLTSQLKYLLSQEDRPEMYFFTAKSAVPVADAFRGFFGDNCPTLGYVKANRESASSYIDQYPFPKLEAMYKRQTEIERLREVAKTVTHACVVEQYANTGRTLRYAALLLREAGVETVSGIRGQWYHEARAEDVRIDELTSTHASFMRGVGELVREQMDDKIIQ